VKTALMVMSALFLACTPSFAAELKKLDLDDIQGLGLKIENDSRVKVEGKSSIRISTLWPTTVCLSFELIRPLLNFLRLILRNRKGPVLVEDIFKSLLGPLQ